jgi:hypothetical protein
MMVALYRGLLTLLVLGGGKFLYTVCAGLAVFQLWACRAVVPLAALGFALEFAARAPQAHRTVAIVATARLLGSTWLFRRRFRPVTNGGFAP